MSVRHAVPAHGLDTPDPDLTVCALSGIPHPAIESCEDSQAERARLEAEFDALLDGPPTTDGTIRHRARKGWSRRG